MRAAKGRISAFFFATISLLLCAPAFASIPRSTTLDPSAIDRYASSDDVEQSSEVLPLHDQLARAARTSWSIESLPETRVGVSELFTPLEHPQQSELSRVLHHAYAHLSGEHASDQTFCHGDPVNCRDPLGLGDGVASGSVSYPDNPMAGETRAHYVERLASSGQVSSMDAAMMGECYFTSTCGSARITELSQQVTTRVKAEANLIARMEVAGVAAVLTGGGAAGLVTTYGGGALLATTVGGAAGGGVGTAVNDKLAGRPITAANVAQGGLEGIGGAYVFGAVMSVVDPGPLAVFTAPARTPQVLLNKAKGDAFSREVGKELAEQYEIAVPQITVVSKSKVRARLDWVTKEGDVIGCVECKTGNAQLSENQEITYSEIEQYGGVVVGKGKPGVPGGTEIPPGTKVVVRRKQ